MKIEINGFSIELMEDDTTLTMTVSDATGKELANNTFTQEAQSDEVKPAQVQSPEEQSQVQAQPQEEIQEEGLIPTLESLKKNLK